MGTGVCSGLSLLKGLGADISLTLHDLLAPFGIPFQLISLGFGSDSGYAASVFYMYNVH